MRRQSAASAQYQPGLQHLLTNYRTQSLLARGFSLGKRPSNFRREVVIDGPDAARRIATETLEILFHTFRYRGPQFVVPLHRGVTEDYLRSALRGFADNMHELDFLVSSRCLEQEPTSALPN